MTTPGRGKRSPRGSKARAAAAPSNQVNGDNELPRIAELESDYEMLGELGRGGTAVVYLARDRELGRKVAIKVIRSTYIEDEEAAARLKREAQTIAGLQHPNLVVLYGTRRLRDKSLALIMQYVEGHTLKQEVKRLGPLSFERVTQILRDIGNALAYAHAHRIVHRDIKPENIYVDDETGIARLSDFGIARPWDSDSNLTLPGSAIGTPAYMSPEQIDGAVLDGRSDLYSLGLVGYEMLTGSRPWAGETLFSIIVKQKHQELPPLSIARPDTPRYLRAAIEGCTSKRLDRRWPDADAFLAALAEYDASPHADVRVALPMITDDVVEEPDAAALTVKYERHTPAAETVELFQQLTDQEERDSRAQQIVLRRQWGRTSAIAGAVVVIGLVASMASGPESEPWQPADVSAAAAPADVVVPGNEVALPTTAEPAPEQPAPERVPTVARALYGARQTGLAGDTLPEPLVLRVEDGAGKPMAGVTVRFAVVRGEGEARPSRAVTDESGAATAHWMPMAPGDHAIEARIDGISEPVPFRARVLARSGGQNGEPSDPPVRGSAPTPAPPPEPRTAAVTIRRTVALGGTHSCALNSDGVASCWGGNDSGQLGDGSVTRRGEPTRVAAPEPLATIAAGVSHSCGIGVSGSVFCWGSNTSGQLGDGTRTSRPQPGRVRLTTGLLSVAVGAAHTCGLDALGKLYCWGQNARGQLGDGTQTERTAPVRAGGNRTYRAVAVGWAHTCALATDGAAFCWGRNSSGQLGDGGTRDRASAAPISGTLRFTALAAGSAHTCGLLANGSIRCWGQNTAGQLGSGDKQPSATGSRVASQELFAAIAAGGVHTCALTRDGVAQCWGRNTHGQLGDNTVEDRTSPVPVATSVRFSAIYANGAHSCGAARDGALYCWGYNVEGQIGDATRSNQLQPVAVGRQE